MIDGLFPSCEEGLSCSLVTFCKSLDNSPVEDLGSKRNVGILNVIRCKAL